MEMKQDIGMIADKHNPISFIVSLHLANLVKFHGNITVTAALMRLKRKKPSKIKNLCEAQLNNIILTYGLDIVSNLHSSIYTLDNAKKVG